MDCEADQQPILESKIYSVEQIYGEDTVIDLELEVKPESKPDEKQAIRSLTNFVFPLWHPIYRFYERADQELKFPSVFSLTFWLITLLFLLIEQIYLVLYTKKLKPFDSTVMYYLSIVILIVLLVLYIFSIFLIKNKRIKIKSFFQSVLDEDFKISKNTIYYYQVFIILHLIQFCFFILGYQNELSNLTYKEKLGIGGLQNLMCISALFYSSFARIIRTADFMDPLGQTNNLNIENIAINFLDCASLYSVFYGSKTQDKVLNQFVDPYFLNITIALWFISNIVRILFSTSINLPLSHFFWKRILKKGKGTDQLISELKNSDLLKKKVTRQIGILDKQNASKGEQKVKFVYTNESNNSNDEEYDDDDNKYGEDSSPVEIMRSHFTFFYRNQLSIKFEKICSTFSVLPEIFSLIIRLYLLSVNAQFEQTWFLFKNIYCLWRYLCNALQSYNCNSKWLNGKMNKWSHLKQSAFWFILFNVSYLSITTLLDYYIYLTNGKTAWIATGVSVLLTIVTIICYFKNLDELRELGYTSSWITYLVGIHNFFLLAAIAGGRMPYLYWGITKLKETRASSFWCQQNLILLIICCSLIFFLLQKSLSAMSHVEENHIRKQRAYSANYQLYQLLNPDTNYLESKLYFNNLRHNEHLLSILDFINAATFLSLALSYQIDYDNKHIYRTEEMLCDVEKWWLYPKAK
ncbi:hypothetical protein M0812_30173 [Anaeramoeba flamelloides]|uniref:Uncharacterized protein n=1 Tax=Anaeramoeba flamelloides TaxID=1746091 RepID=A0AAV7Y657_9EUKA|nr:hypothetical protein M0812_30173 [Anaeramoeba flamelloides]